MSGWLNNQVSMHCDHSGILGAWIPLQLCFAQLCCDHVSEAPRCRSPCSLSQTVLCVCHCHSTCPSQQLWRRACGQPQRATESSWTGGCGRLCPTCAPIGSTTAGVSHNQALPRGDDVLLNTLPLPAAMAARLRTAAEGDQEFLDRGLRAFVSYVRAYRAHHCRQVPICPVANARRCAAPSLASAVQGKSPTPGWSPQAVADTPLHACATSVLCI